MQVIEWLPWPSAAARGADLLSVSEVHPLVFLDGIPCPMRGSDSSAITNNLNTLEHRQAAFAPVMAVRSMMHYFKGAKLGCLSYQDRGKCAACHNAITASDTIKRLLKKDYHSACLGCCNCHGGATRQRRI